MYGTTIGIQFIEEYEGGSIGNSPQNTGDPASVEVLDYPWESAPKAKVDLSVNRVIVTVFGMRTI